MNWNKLLKHYHVELKCWRLSVEQKGLIIAFLFCLKLRMDGTDFTTYWNNLCEGGAVSDGSDYQI